MARLQHYLFAHKRLPRLFHANPLLFVEEMRSAQAQTFLLNFWAAIADDLDSDDLDPDDLVNALGLTHTSQETEDYEIIVISLPPPKAMAEAYFVCLWISYSDASKGEPFRYFTLELHQDLDWNDNSTLTPATVLCEWTKAGEHRNYGSGSEPEIEQFMKKIITVTMGTQKQPSPVGQAAKLESSTSGKTQPAAQTGVTGHDFFMQEVTKLIDGAQSPVLSTLPAKKQPSTSQTSTKLPDSEIIKRLAEVKQPTLGAHPKSSSVNGTFSRSELREIAKYHRLLLWSTLFAIVVNLAHSALGNSVYWIMFLAAAALEILSLYKLGRSFKFSGSRMVLFILGLLVPLISLLILLFMHKRVMQTMKAAGVKVGFMGADPKTI